MAHHHFYHGDFGWGVDLDSGIVDWDGEGEEEPTEDEVDAASNHWENDGYNEYQTELADEIGDMKYEQWRESRWED